MIMYLDGSEPCNQAEVFMDQMKTEYRQVLYFKVYTCFADDIAAGADSQKPCPYVQFYMNSKVHK